MNKIFFLWLLILAINKLSQAQVIGNTINSCFYARYYQPFEGDLIASIQIAGSNESNLAQCCEKCRAFPNCNLWSYSPAALSCYFYSSYTNLTSTGTTDFYIGKRSGSLMWNCNEEIGKYYFENSLGWVRQTLISAVFNRAGCCQDCFWSKGTVPNCYSYMYNEISRDCYHTSKNYSETLSIQYSGMYTGSATLNLATLKI